MAAVTTHSDFGAQVEEICHCFHLFPSICHGGSDGKASACNAGDLGLIPGSGRSPGEGMATHSSILAWRIPWTEEPGGLQSMGPQRVRHNWTFFTEPAERVRLRPYSRRRKIALTSLWFQIRIQFLMRWWKGWSRALCMDPLRQHSSSSSLSSLREYQIKTHQQALPKVCYIYLCKCTLQ